MKIQHLLIASSLALVPAVAAKADDAKKEALKKAKEEAKAKAKEAAKEKLEAKKEEKKEEVKEKKAEKVAEKKADEADAAKAAEEEKTAHAKNMGAIERLQQIADATSNADLKAAVARLTEKENKRHGLAAPAT